MHIAFFIFYPQLFLYFSKRKLVEIIALNYSTLEEYVQNWSWEQLVFEITDEESELEHIFMDNLQKKQRLKSSNSLSLVSKEAQLLKGEKENN